jgi:hypothetical protein
VPVVKLARAALLVTTTAGVVLATATPALAAPGPDTVTVTGTYTEVVADTHAPGGPATPVPMVTVGDTTVALDAPVSADLTSGQQVSVEVEAPPSVDTGREVAAALSSGLAEVVDVNNVSTAPTSAAAVAATATSDHSLTVLPVHWSGPDEQTTTSLTSLATKVGSFWRTQSRGAVRLSTPIVRGWKKIAAPASCDYDALATLITTTKKAFGVTTASERDHVLVYFPEWRECSWAGLAELYGPHIWINGYAHADGWEHEFGHNLGLGHANSAQCSTWAMPEVTVEQSGCPVHHYDDLDVMGYARYGDGLTLNAALADRLAVLDAVPVATVGSSYTVAPITATSGQRAVKVELPGSTLYVEYRPAAANAVPELAGWSGVQVRQRFADGLESYLLLPPDDGSTPRFGLGQPVGIVGTGLAMVVDGVSSTGAKVRFGTPTTTVGAPVITLRPGASTSAGTPVTLAASASNLADGICELTATVNGRRVGSATSGRLRVSTSLPSNRSSQVVVSATDCVGVTRTRSVSMRATLAGNSAGRFSTGWSTVRGSRYAGGAAKSTKRAGAKASWTFTGSRVGWVGSRRSWTGTAKMYIDGRYAGKVDTRGASANRRLMWARSVRSGQHRLTIVVTGTKGRPTVFQDGFVSLR